MSDPLYVLDTSALLCVLLDEPGAAFVAERMTGALVSAINYAEVILALVDRGVPNDEIVPLLGELDVEIVPVDRRQAESAGLMRLIPDSAGLSIGERSCLALAMVRRRVVVTTNPAWMDMDLEPGVELAK